SCRSSARYFKKLPTVTADAGKTASRCCAQNSANCSRYVEYVFSVPGTARSSNHRVKSCACFCSDSLALCPGPGIIAAVFLPSLSASIPLASYKLRSHSAKPPVISDTSLDQAGSKIKQHREEAPVRC